MTVPDEITNSDIKKINNDIKQLVQNHNPPELSSPQKSKCRDCFFNIYYIASLPITLPYRGATYIVSGIVNTAKATGSGIATAAKATGKGISHTANAILDKKFHILFGSLAIATGIIPHHLFPNTNVADVNNNQLDINYPQESYPSDISTQTAYLPPEENFEEEPVLLPEKEIVNQDPIKEEKPQVTSSKGEYVCHPCNIIKSKSLENTVVTTATWIKQGWGRIKNLFN